MRTVIERIAALEAVERRSVVLFWARRPKSMEDMMFRLYIYRGLEDRMGWRKRWNENASSQTITTQQEIVRGVFWGREGEEEERRGEEG